MTLSKSLATLTLAALALPALAQFPRFPQPPTVPLPNQPGRPGPWMPNPGDRPGQGRWDRGGRPVHTDPSFWIKRRELVDEEAKKLHDEIGHLKTELGKSGLQKGKAGWEDVQELVTAAEQLQSRVKVLAAVNAKRDGDDHNRLFNHMNSVVLAQKGVTAALTETRKQFEDVFHNLEAFKFTREFAEHVEEHWLAAVQAHERLDLRIPHTLGQRRPGGGGKWWEHDNR